MGSVTKLALVREFMASNDWRAAVLAAAKFQELGPQRNAILSAREAYLRPDFQKQLGKCPDTLIAEGEKALIERYGNV